MRLRLVEMREATPDEKAELKRAIEARSISEVKRVLDTDALNVVTFNGVADSLAPEDRTWIDSMLQSSLLD